MKNKNDIKVLVVDDEKIVRDFLTRLLNIEGIRVESADDGYRALELAQKDKFDLFFLDIKMPKMGGLETFCKLKKIDPTFNCVFMTGYAQEADLFEKTKQSGIICLRKPFEDIGQIKEIINRVLLEDWTGAEIQERRALMRFNIALEIDYKPKQGQVPFGHSLSKDISLSGISLCIPENIARGTILELILKVQGEAGICKATGEVIWNKAVEDKPGYYETGINFAEVDYSDLAVMISRFVK